MFLNTTFIEIRIFIMSNLDTGCFSNYWQVRDKRNETMHSSTLSFTQDEMRDAFTKMMDLLKKILQNLSAENESEIKEIKKTIDILDKVSAHLLIHWFKYTLLGFQLFFIQRLCTLQPF